MVIILTAWFGFGLRIKIMWFAAGQMEALLLLKQQMEAGVNEIAVNFDLAIPLDRSTSSTKQVSKPSKDCAAKSWMD